MATEVKKEVKAPSKIKSLIKSPARITLLIAGIFFILALVENLTGATDITSPGTSGATLRFAIPLLMAGLGGLWAERAGVINIGLEGMMIVGTWTAAWARSRPADAAGPSARAGRRCRGPAGNRWCRPAGPAAPRPSRGAGGAPKAAPRLRALAHPRWAVASTRRRRLLGPQAAAARTRYGMNSRWPPEMLPIEVGSWIECVASKQTG